MVETDLHISKRLKAILPPQTADERKQLEANILKDGRVIDPILYWYDGKQNVVIDGMTRWEIIKRKGITDFSTQQVRTAGETYEEVEAWIWDHQSGRRNMTREAIGRWYNQIKTTHGGDRKSKIKVSNDTLIDAAESVAEKAGVSAATVKRDGARVEALEKCTTAVQKGVETQAIKLSDAEVKTLAGLPAGDQNAIATDLRKGEASNVKESMKLRGIKQPAKKKPTKKKPPKKLDRKALYKEWTKAIAVVVKLVDRIARDCGETGCQSQDVLQGQLEACTQEMGEWMGV